MRNALIVFIVTLALGLTSLIPGFISQGHAATKVTWTDAGIYRKSVSSNPKAAPKYTEIKGAVLLKSGYKQVPEASVLLEVGQKAVPFDAVILPAGKEILKDGYKQVPIDQPVNGLVIPAECTNKFQCDAQWGYVLNPNINPAGICVNYAVTKGVLGAFESMKGCK